MISKRNWTLLKRKPRNLIKKKLYFYPSRIITKYEISTPERFAFRLAMTVGVDVIARLPIGKSWQSRFANLWFANRVGESQSL
jgi:hypothetical protein